MAYLCHLFTLHSLFIQHNGLHSKVICMSVNYFEHMYLGTCCSMAVMICRSGASQSVNNVLGCIKKSLHHSPECMPAIAKIAVQLLLPTEDSTKVTKPLIQVHIMCV